MSLPRLLKIGFVGSIRSPVVGRYVDGVLAYAGLHRRIQVVDLRLSAELPRFQATDLPPWRDRVDGVMLCMGYGGPADEVIGWVGRGRVPAVSVGGDIIDPRLPVVHADPESIARLATEHFLGLGVSSFLYLGSRRCQRSRAGAEGLVRVLAGRGQAPAAHECETPVFGGIDDEPLLAGDQRLTDLLTTLPKPLGILCLNDAIARVVAMRCATLGLEVGVAVAIVGVEDSVIAAGSTPSITSIKIPCETVAARGLAAVCEMIEAERLNRPEMPVELVPATELVARESTLGRSPNPSSLGNWLAYFGERGHKGFATARVAEELGLSQRTFERQFQKLVGHSPAEEIRRRRLERAKTLLADPALPVAAIAAELGFANAAAFSRFFRQHAGCTPREYRQEAAARLLG